uniref:Uncharacterized protein n=1 Tax=Strongyloides venezuelensis TaxID=75913 RepID=A0A0K0F561_STRVS
MCEIYIFFKLILIFYLCNNLLGYKLQCCPNYGIVICYIVIKPEGKTFKNKVLPLLNNSIKLLIFNNWQEYSKDSRKLYELNREIRHKLDRNDIYTICAKLKILEKCTYHTYLILTTKSRNRIFDFRRNTLNRFSIRGSFKNFRSSFGRYSFNVNNQDRSKAQVYRRSNSFKEFHSPSN